jgi:hypothetical protein
MLVDGIRPLGWCLDKVKDLADQEIAVAPFARQLRPEWSFEGYPTQPPLTAAQNQEFFINCQGNRISI